MLPEVGRHFNYSGNRLTPLRGTPKYVGGMFDCSSNKLTSFDGQLVIIVSSFFTDNNLISTSEIQGIKRPIPENWKLNKYGRYNVDWNVELTTKYVRDRKLTVILERYLTECSMITPSHIRCMQYHSSGQ